jgi:hypothetical protein
MEEIRKAKAQRKRDALDRIPIEGTFGQGKNGYRLNYIRARTVKTAEAWVRTIFLVMNLQIFKQEFVRSENGGCKVPLLKISFRSILVAEVRIGVIWSENLAI